MPASGPFEMTLGGAVVCESFAVLAAAGTRAKLHRSKNSMEAGNRLTS